LHLTAQTAGLRQALGRVKHVDFVFLRLVYAVVEASICDYDMACAASALSTTCPFQLQAEHAGDIEQIFTSRSGKLVVLVLLVDEGYIVQSKKIAVVLASHMG
jgi:hypothetical protein